MLTVVEKILFIVATLVSLYFTYRGVARIMQHIRCRQIVLDGTNSRYHIAQWKATADSLHLRLHSVAESGAYVLE